MRVPQFTLPGGGSGAAGRLLHSSVACGFQLRSQSAWRREHERIDGQLSRLPACDQPEAILEQRLQPQHELLGRHHALLIEIRLGRLGLDVEAIRVHPVWPADELIRLHVVGVPDEVADHLVRADEAPAGPQPERGALFTGRVGPNGRDLELRLRAITLDHLAGHWYPRGDRECRQERRRFGTVIRTLRRWSETVSRQSGEP